MSVALALLAAGSSTRMGNNRHKLLALFDGIALVRRSALVALQSGASPVIAVLGHRAAELRQHLDDLDVRVVVNDDYAAGLSTSLRACVAHVPKGTSGLMIQLADMPAISAANLSRLIQIFEDAGGKAVVRATTQGMPGHPVILPMELLPSVATLTGDIGARDLITSSGLPVLEVELGPAASLDVDIPQDMAAAGGLFST